MVSLMFIAPLSGCLSFSGDDDEKSMEDTWIDPVIEIENEYHSHNDLLAHRLSTPNVQLIDYHNLNCDGNVSPPPELDNIAGRPCDDEYKNTGPTPGDNSTLSPADRTRAEQIRDAAFLLTERLGLYKYLYNTYEYKLKLANGTQPIMDSVTTATYRPPETKFSTSKLPTKLKSQFMNKPRKNKDDFRFNFVGVTANIDLLKLDDPHWKNKYAAEFATWSTEKAAWAAMDSTIVHASTNYSIRPRTSSDEQLHQKFLDAKDMFEQLRVELEVLKLECKILCGPYEKINDVCTWKRSSQTNEFNLKEFQLKCPVEYADPAHYSTSKEKVSVKVVPYKTYA